MPGTLLIDDWRNAVGDRLRDVADAAQKAARQPLQAIGAPQRPQGPDAGQVFQSLQSTAQQALGGLQPLQPQAQDVQQRLQQAAQQVLQQPQARLVTPTQTPVLGAATQPFQVPAGASDRVRGQAEVIGQASSRTGVPSAVIAAIMDTEAGGPRSTSSAGAKGFMQIMPQHFKPGEDPYDPTLNITRGAEILADNYRRYGSWDKAAAAYFGSIDSQGNITGARDVLGTSGPTYVQKFQTALRQYGGGAEGAPGLVERIQGQVQQAAAPFVEGAQALKEKVGADISQFGDSQLSNAEAYAACGPAAAVRFAQRFGRNPTLREALDLAKTVGWTQGAGMAGIQSQQNLMSKLGVPTKLIPGAQWDQFAKEAQSGNPVTISTSAHYFYADGYDPQSGAFHVGRSGTDLRGGKEWMTRDEIVGAAQRLGGGNVQGALFADSPLVPSASAAGRTETAPAGPRMINLRSDTAQPTNQPSLAMREMPAEDQRNPIQVIGDEFSKLGTNVQQARQWAMGETQEAARAEGFSPAFQERARQAAAVTPEPMGFGETAKSLLPFGGPNAPGQGGPLGATPVTQQEIILKRAEINKSIEQHPAFQDWPVGGTAGVAIMATQMLFDPVTYLGYGPSLRVGAAVGRAATAGALRFGLPEQIATRFPTELGTNVAIALPGAVQKLTKSAIANGLQNAIYEAHKPNADPVEVGKQFIWGAALGSALEFSPQGLAKTGRFLMDQADRIEPVGTFLRSESGELRLPGGEPPRPPIVPGAVPEERIEPMGAAPSMGGGTVGISQSPTFLRESLRRMYPGAINKAAAKEAVQNSVDASRGIPGAVTKVDVNNSAKTISIVDQGKGMTPETMEDVFVQLGGTKKPEGASGGMGTAIKAIMANAEDTWVRTIGRDESGGFTDSIMHGSGDDFLGGTMHRYYARLGEMPDSELQGAPLEIQQLHGANENITGTAIWTKPMSDVQWDDYTLHGWINSFNKVSRIPDQSVQFTVDGTPVASDQIIRGTYGKREAAPIVDSLKPTQFLKTVDTPGAEIDVYGSQSTSETGYTEVKLLNNGQYQADMFVQLPGNAKMPTTLVADVRATIGPKEVGYPWTADRNGLIDTAQQAVKNYVARELAGDLIGKENTRVSELINNAPMVGPVKLVDDAGIGNTSAADTFNKIPKNPSYRKLASINNDLHESLIAELEGREIPNPEGYSKIGHSELLGLGVSDKWLGLNVPSSMTPWAGTSDGSRGILMNPWAVWMEVERSWPGATRAEQIDRFTDGLIATMIHEISHNTPVGGHSEGFAGILTRVPQFLGARMHAAIVKSIRGQLTTVWDKLGDQLSYDANEFRRAAGESSLERYGTAARSGGRVERAGTPGDDLPLPDQGGAGARRRPGGAGVRPDGTPEGVEPQPPPGGVNVGPAPTGAEPAPTGVPGTTPPAGVAPAAAGDDVVAQAVRSGGKRAAQATEDLAQAIVRIKPTLSRKQFNEAKADLAKMPRSGQRVIGLPPGITSPEDLAALRVHLNELVDDGVAGKDWYINSARKIKEAVGGDMVEAERLAQLVGMMARNVNPEQNVNYAIEAWNQWKGGIPVANVHRFTDVSKSAADLLERGIPWAGRKTNSFYINLMEELDPTLLAKRKVTADIWVNRAFGYHGKAPAGGQYNFIEDELRRIADQRGQRPSQIQAQLWVGQMARQAPNADGAADFSHALARRMGQVSWETAPDTVDIPGYAGASPEAQAAYNREVGQAFLDDNGTDIVTRALGGLGGHTFETPGGWQTQVGVAQTAAATPGGQVVKPASRQTIEAVAAAKGWLLKRPEVSWTQVFPATTAKAANAVDLDAGRSLTLSEVDELSAALTQEMSGANPLQGENVPFSLTFTEHGAWLRNTSNMPHAQFHKAVDAAIQGVQSDADFTATAVRADSGRIVNDWSTQPDGEGYLDAVRRGGREEAFRSVQDSLGQRVAAAQQDAARHLGAAPEGGAEPGGILRSERGEASPQFGLNLGGAAAGGYAGYAATPEDAPLEEKLRNTAIGVGTGLVGARMIGKGLRPPPGALAGATDAVGSFRAPGGPVAEDLAGGLLEARRRGQGRQRPPRPPAGRTPRPAGEPEPERAGNILLPKYVQDEVREIIEESWRNNPARFEEARRGVVPDEVVRQLAETVGKDVGRITSLWKPGDAKNAETIHALRTALADRALAVTDTQAIARKAPNSLDARNAYIEALAKHAAVQDVVAGISGEAGRSLRALRQPIVGEHRALQLLEKLAKANKTTPEEFAEVLLKKDLSDPMDVARAARAISDFTVRDKLEALWYFALLSNPMTHIKNAVSNGLVLATRPVETAAAAAIDLPRYAIAAGGQKLMGKPVTARRERFFGETPAVLFGYGAAAPDSLREAINTMRTGITSAQLANPELAGKAEPFSGHLADLTVNVPGRALQASDAMFRGMHVMGSMYQLAYRQAAQEGVKPQNMGERIAQIIANPDKKMLAVAADEGAYRVFQQKGDFVNMAGMLREKVPGLKFPLPFVQTPYNVGKYSLERTPLALSKLATDPKGGGELSDRLARASVGTATMWFFYDQVVKGNVTGEAPRDPTERDAFQRQGKQPYSIKVGDTWHSYAAFQPLTTMLGGVVSFHEAQQAAGEDNADVPLAMLTGGFAFGRALLDQPWLQGTQELIDLMSGADVRNPDDILDRVSQYMQRSLTSPIPSIVRALARAQDTTIRKPERGMAGIPQAFAAAIPGLQGNAPAALSAFGEERQRPQGGIASMFDPRQPSEATDDPLELELARLQRLKYNVQPGLVGRRVTMLKAPVELTEAEQRRYQMLAGTVTQEVLGAVVESSSYKALPDSQKVEVIEKVTERIRAATRESMMPQLAERAIEYHADQLQLRREAGERELAGVP